MIEHNFKIDDWLVETKLGRISRKSEAIQLEPQVMKVLCCLAEHSGDVVAKTYLTETLWQSTYVSDAALARCISQIRSALGDSRKDPKYVQTIPKVGYRLIANVQLNCEMTLHAKLFKGSRTVAGAATVAVSVTTAIVLSFTTISQSDNSTSLAFAPITIQSEQDYTENSFWAISARVLEEQVRTGLDDIGEQIVVYDESTRNKYTSENTGHNYLNRLLGTVTESNGDINFRFDLIENRTGDTIWSNTYSALQSDVFSVSSDVVKNIAFLLDAKLSPAVIQELARPKTRDVLAYDAFHRAEKNFRQFTLVDVKNAITLYEQAVNYDPQFALAHAELAHVLAMEARFWGGTRTVEALQAAEKAIALDPDMYQGYHAYGDTQSENGDFDSALRAYDIALDLNPAHAPTMFEIANVHFERLDYASAKTFYLRAVEIEPDYNAAMSQLGYLYLNAGDIKEAKRWLDRTLENVPLHIPATLGLASIDIVTGRHISAVSRCKKITEMYPTNYTCLQTSAVASLLHEDLTTARNAFRKMAQARPDDGYAQLGEAQILIAEGKPEQASILIDKVLKQHQDRVASKESCVLYGSDCWQEYWMIAASYALKNDRENAYVWLDRTAAAGRRNHLWDVSDPVFSSLRNDAEFNEYIATIKFNYW